MSSAQKEATVQARSDRSRVAGRGEAGRAAKQEAAVMTDSVKDQHAEPGQGLDESWEDRVAKFDELEDAKLHEMRSKRAKATLKKMRVARVKATLEKMLDARVKATLEKMLDAREEARLEWYKKVGIHRDFARDYARHAARMSC